MKTRGFIVAGLALAAALSPPGVTGQASDPLEAMNVLRPAAPAPAPDVVFRSLDGHEARLRDLRGKPVLLGFFTTW